MLRSPDVSEELWAAASYATTASKSVASRSAAFMSAILISYYLLLTIIPDKPNVPVDAPDPTADLDGIEKFRHALGSVGGIVVICLRSLDNIWFI